MANAKERKREKKYTGKKNIAHTSPKKRQNKNVKVATKENVAITIINAIKCR